MRVCVFLCLCVYVFLWRIVAVPLIIIDSWNRLCFCTFTVSSSSCLARVCLSASDGVCHPCHLSFRLNNTALSHCFPGRKGDLCLMTAPWYAHVFHQTTWYSSGCHPCLLLNAIFVSLCLIHVCCKAVACVCLWMCNILVLHVAYSDTRSLFSCCLLILLWYKDCKHYYSLSCLLHNACAKPVVLGWQKNISHFPSLSHSLTQPLSHVHNT